MEKATKILIRSIAPTVMLSLVLSLLFLARDIGSLRRRWTGRLYLVLVFGFISSLGLLGRIPIRNAHLDTAILVVLVAGLYGGFAVGVGAAAVGSLVKLAVVPRTGSFVLITLLAGALGAVVHHLRKGRPVPPAGGFLAGTGAGVLQGILTAALLKAPVTGAEVLVGLRKGKDTRHVLDPAGIDFFRAEGDGCACRARGETYEVRMALGDLEALLAERGFMRVHRSYLVNLGRVVEIVPWFAGEVMLKFSAAEEPEVPVARRQAADLKRRLGWK